MNISRRTFLGGSLLGGAALGLGLLGVPSLRAQLEKHLESLFGHAVSSSDAGQAFLDAYAISLIEQLKASNDLGGSVSSQFSEVAGDRIADSIMNHAIGLVGVFGVFDAYLHEKILSKFMMSTNFAAVDGDPAQLRMVALFDPYKTPCLNQLSRWSR